MRWGSFFGGLFVGVVVSIAGYFGWKYFYSKDSQESAATLAAQNEQNTAEEDLPQFTSLFKDDGTRNAYQKDSNEKLGILVNDNEDLTKTWKELFAGSLPPPKPKTNFNNQSILIVMSEFKPTLGYSMIITDVKIGNEIIVQVEDQRPGEGCLVSQQVNRPLHVVAIDKVVDKDITIVSSRTNDTPCLVPLN